MKKCGKYVRLEVSRWMNGEYVFYLVADTPMYKWVTGFSVSSFTIWRDGRWAITAGEKYRILQIKRTVPEEDLSVMFTLSQGIPVVRIIGFVSAEIEPGLYVSAEVNVEEKVAELKDLFSAETSAEGEEGKSELTNPDFPAVVRFYIRELPMSMESTETVVYRQREKILVYLRDKDTAEMYASVELHKDASNKQVRVIREWIYDQVRQAMEKGDQEADEITHSKESMSEHAKEVWKWSV